MKWFVPIALAASMLLQVPVGAQEDSTSAPSDQGAEKPASQAEVGRVLVKALGLSLSLPPNPSDQEIFSMLLLNKISPEGGWSSNKPMTKGDLARIVVFALGDQDEVEDADDPESYVDYLTSIGVPIDSVGIATSQVGPRGDRDDSFFASTRPDKSENRKPSGLSISEIEINQPDLPVNIPVSLQDIINILNSVQDDIDLPPVTPN